jgi:hypothetical protein
MERMPPPRDTPHCGIRLSDGETTESWLRCRRKKYFAHSAKYLQFPTITSLGAAQHAHRHVANSITTLRLQLAVALAIGLGHCPHCSSVDLRLRF